MIHTYSYRRQVSNLPSLVTQQYEIHTFALKKGLHVDKEVIEYSNKNLLIEEREEFEVFLRSMQEGNTVIVSELSILSDKAEELISVINCMLSHDVDLWIVSVNLLINKETNMVDIFPLLNDIRQETSEKKKQIGRPKGSKSSSKFDAYHGQIIALMTKGLSVSAVARELEVSRSSLKDYIESRSIKELVEGVGKQMHENVDKSMDNVVLICPFREMEKQNNKSQGAIA